MNDRPGPESALIISASVGAGHDGAASELAARLRDRGMDVDVRDYLDALPRACPFFLRTGYTSTVELVPFAFQWLFWAIDHVRVVQAAMLAFCRLGDREVARWTRQRRYDVVISTYPLASQSLGNLRARGQLRTPVVTYLTDPAAHRGWVHPAVDHHLTVIGEAARQGSADYGLAMAPAGPLVPARFSSRDDDRAQAVRRDLGLSTHAQVALIVTGSLGLGDVGRTTRLVLSAGLVPVVLCGRNEKLRRRLSGRPGVVALGWRSDVDTLMQVADVLVHNAGGLTFTEALVAGLPAVSYRCIPGHGRANAAVLERAGLAPWSHTTDGFIQALRHQAARPRLRRTFDDPATLILQLVGLTATAPVPVSRISVGPAPSGEPTRLPVPVSAAA